MSYLFVVLFGWFLAVMAGVGLKGSHAKSRGREGRLVMANPVALLEKWCSEFIKGCHTLLKYAI